jgi:hypothetical protein
MGIKVEFTDNTALIAAEIEEAADTFLMEAGGEIAGRAAENSRVDTGQLKKSWSYRLVPFASAVEIGSPLENAIWEEFGTGRYAENGDGRKTPWMYEDAKGWWHWTAGKRPQRTLRNAYTAMRDQIIAEAQRRFGEIGK